MVSERHVAEKFRYHIGNTDVVSEKNRCGIGIFPLRAFSDTTSETISNRAHIKKIRNLYFTLHLLNFNPRETATF